MYVFMYVRVCVNMCMYNPQIHTVNFVSWLKSYDYK